MKKNREPASPAEAPDAITHGDRHGETHRMMLEGETNPVRRWIESQPKEGQYAAWGGFLREATSKLEDQNGCEELVEAINGYGGVFLYAIVYDWIQEAIKDAKR